MKKKIFKIIIIALAIILLVSLIVFGIILHIFNTDGEIDYEETYNETVWFNINEIELTNEQKEIKKNIDRLKINITYNINSDYDILYALSFDDYLLNIINYEKGSDLFSDYIKAYLTASTADLYIDTYNRVDKKQFDKYYNLYWNSTTTLVLTSKYYSDRVDYYNEEYGSYKEYLEFAYNDEFTSCYDDYDEVIGCDKYIEQQLAQLELYNNDQYYYLEELTGLGIPEISFLPNNLTLENDIYTYIVDVGFINSDYESYNYSNNLNGYLKFKIINGNYQFISFIIE